MRRIDSTLKRISRKIPYPTLLSIKFISESLKKHEVSLEFKILFSSDLVVVSAADIESPDLHFLTFIY